MQKVLTASFKVVTEKCITHAEYQYKQYLSAINYNYYV